MKLRSLFENWARDHNRKLRSEAWFKVSVVISLAAASVLALGYGLLANLFFVALVILSVRNQPRFIVLRKVLGDDGVVPDPVLGMIADSPEIPLSLGNPPPRPANPSAGRGPSQRFKASAAFAVQHHSGVSLRGAVRRHTNAQDHFSRLRRRAASRRRRVVLQATVARKLPFPNAGGGGSGQLHMARRPYARRAAGVLFPRAAGTDLWRHPIIGGRL